MGLQKEFKAWGHCYDCHFDGLLIYTYIDGEDYEDNTADGVMLNQRCPSCDTDENALIPMEYYQEMLDHSKDSDE